MDGSEVASGSNRRVLVAIAVIVGIYGIACACGLPQQGLERLARWASHDIAEHSAGLAAHPPYWTVAPFVALLGAIAVFPLMPGVAHWWDSNLHRFFVAAGLGAGTLLYYLLLCEHPIVLHWPIERVVAASPHGANVAATLTVLVNSLIHEYFPFIVLLFTLYTISGGIRIEGDLQARPSTNAAFLAAGAVLASFIGTTGAAMLLIRPLLETNSERKRVVHTVIFFIFIVCNCGGCLLPLGDPPLFLGYILEVPFFWTLRLWPEWLLVNSLLVAMYYVWDRFWHYPREQRADVARDKAQSRALQFMGLWPNGVLLVGVILSIAFLDPSKPVPGTHWQPWLHLREMVQLVLVALSLVLGSRSIRRQNNFNYAAIVEVAALFSGIFVCMQPALEILHVKGPSLGLQTPAHFFWASGSLSAVLDNAPTYVVFFATAKSLEGAAGQPLIAGVRESLLVAVSLGAVFMGAMTYIGNGPNFMVRAIAEKAGIRMPSFFGYMLYSCLILLPVFALVTLLLR